MNITMLWYCKAFVKWWFRAMTIIALVIILILKTLTNYLRKISKWTCNLSFWRFNWFDDFWLSRQTFTSIKFLRKEYMVRSWHQFHIKTWSFAILLHCSFFSCWLKIIYKLFEILKSFFLLMMCYYSVESASLTPY